MADQAQQTANQAQQAANQAQQSANQAQQSANQAQQDASKALQLSHEEALRNHLKWRYKDKVQIDIDDQLGAWEGAADDLVNAFANALERFTRIISHADVLLMKEEQERFDLAVFALSLMTAGAMRFVGGVIQYRAVPRFFGKRTWTPTMIKFAEREWWMVDMVTTKNPQITGKVLGGLTEDILKTAIVKVSSAAQPHEARDDDAETVRKELGTVEDLRNATRSVLRAIRKEARHAISREIDKSDAKDWAPRWLAGGGGDVDRAKYALDAHVHAMRQEWAGKWQFYGTNPNLPSVSEMETMIEKGIWAVWVAASGIQVVQEKVVVDYRHATVITKDKLSRNVHSSVAHRLSVLGIWDVVAARYWGAGASGAWAYEGDIDTPQEWRSLQWWAMRNPMPKLDVKEFEAKPRQLPFLDEISR